MEVNEKINKILLTSIKPPEFFTTSHPKSHPILEFFKALSSLAQKLDPKHTVGGEKTSAPAPFLHRNRSIFLSVKASSSWWILLVFCISFPLPPPSLGAAFHISVKAFVEHLQKALYFPVDGKQPPNQPKKKSASLEILKRPTEPWAKMYVCVWEKFGSI